MFPGMLKQSSSIFYYFLFRKLYASRRGSCLGLFLHCDKLCKDGDWSIDIDLDIKLMSVKGKIISRRSSHCFPGPDGGIQPKGFGWPNFIEWDQMEKDHKVDDDIFVMAHVKIKKITGINNRKRQFFDETTSDFSDVVLIVEDEKFHVSKLVSKHFVSIFIEQSSVNSSSSLASLLISHHCSLEILKKRKSQKSRSLESNLRNFKIS